MVAEGVAGGGAHEPSPSIGGVVEVVVRADFALLLAPRDYSHDLLETSGVSRFSVVDVYQEVCLTSELCPALQLEEHRHAFIYCEFVA